MEQLLPDPDADAGADNWNDKGRDAAGGINAEQAEHEFAHKAAQDAQHDVAQGAGLTAHDAACNVTGQRRTSRLDEKYAQQHRRW